jgi:ankyrin repeat protein
VIRNQSMVYAVHYCAEMGMIDRVRALHRAGVDLDLPDVNGVTALSCVLEKNPTMVFELLRLGASAKALDRNTGLSLIWRALAAGAPETVLRALAQAGALVNQTESSGLTLVERAHAENQPHVIPVLVSIGAPDPTGLLERLSYPIQPVPGAFSLNRFSGFSGNRAKQ